MKSKTLKPKTSRAGASAKAAIVRETSAAAKIEQTRDATGPRSQAVPAHEIVAAMFDVIVDEAQRNQTFARRLLSVYPQAIVARIEKREPRNSGFNAADYHAVNILKVHGEAMLRGRLSSLRTKSQLRRVATRSGLKLTGTAARRSASIAQIVDGIVEAAKTYLAQRAAAVG